MTVIREAVSNIAGVFGDAFAELVTGLGDPDGRALRAVPDPAWSDTPGGIMAYGETNPSVATVTGDKTIAVKVTVPDTAFTVFWECAAMRITCTPDGSGWKAGAVVFTPGGTGTCLGSVLDLDTEYNLAATYEQSTGTLKLYVNGVEDGDTSFSEARDTITPLPIWRMGGPPESVVTDGAVWSRILAPSEMPGTAPLTVTIEQGSGQSDPAPSGDVVFDVVFSEAVTGFSTGDVTLSGTAGATTGTVVDSGDHINFTVTVSGMTGYGTVIADIAAAVCASTATGLPNEASTSTDNSVTWGNAPNPTMPSALGYIQDHTNLADLLHFDVVGDYLYVAHSGRLTVVNVSNKTTPTIAGSLSHANLSGAFGCKVSGNYAFVACTSDRLTVVNISNPASPSYAGTVTHSTQLDSARSLDVAGNYAYVPCPVQDRLTVVDISTPASPTIAGTVQDNTHLDGAQDVHVVGSYAYVACGNGDRLAIVNISNPALPSVVTSYTSANLDGAAAVRKVGNYAYLTSITMNCLTIVDVSNPASPTLAGSLIDAVNLGGAQGLWVEGSYAYVAAQLQSRITIVDISNPALPAVVGSVSDGVKLNSVQRVMVVNNYLYATSTVSDQVSIVDV